MILEKQNSKSIYLQLLIRTNHGIKEDKAEWIQMISNINCSSIRHTQHCIRSFCKFDKEGTVFTFERIKCSRGRGGGGGGGDYQDCLKWRVGCFKSFFYNN